MPYIPPSVVQEVKRMDLLTYLKNYEPYELVHFSGNTYTTRTHDSLKISNGKWMWWSQRTGGRSALDYLIKVRGYSFLEAVELLAERANIQPSLSVSENVPMEKQLLLPKKNQDDQKVIAYLSGRGIDKEIIQFCLESGRVYESAFHHNAVFVGMDEKENPKYAAIRGIGTSFIGEANGSDKNYSFSIFTEKPNDTVHLFESAIDLLSYATLQKLDGKEWRREHLLSLAGVYQPAKEIEKSKVPAALARALKMHPEVKTIVLHLDNDRIGRLATKAISTVLPKQYQIKDVPPKQGKDYNDLLCILKNLRLIQIIGVCIFCHSPCCFNCLIKPAALWQQIHATVADCSAYKYTDQICFFGCLLGFSVRFLTDRGCFFYLPGNLCIVVSASACDRYRTHYCCNYCNSFFQFCI